MSDSTALKPKEEKAIAALLASPTHEEAAKAAGISSATLRRYLADPAFAREYRAARRWMVEVAVGRLQQAAVAAVGTLERNLTCGKAADEVRAAVAILAHAYRGVELLDLDERLEQVERNLRGENSRSS
jgi:hypothetical protein